MHIVISINGIIQTAVFIIHNTIVKLQEHIVNNQPIHAPPTQIIATIHNISINIQINGINEAKIIIIVIIIPIARYNINPHAKVIKIQYNGQDTTHTIHTHRLFISMSIQIKHMHKHIQIIHAGK
jgi:hypothetical protein